MKNVLLTLLLFAGFALADAHGQSCKPASCTPCPPGCCVVNCCKSEAASVDGAASEIFAPFMTQTVATSNVGPIKAKSCSATGKKALVENSNASCIPTPGCRPSAGCVKQASLIPSYQAASVVVQH